MASTGINFNTMKNEQIKQCLRVQLMKRNPGKRIAKTVYPDIRLPFNQWAQYIRKEAVNA